MQGQSPGGEPSVFAGSTRLGFHRALNAIDNNRLVDFLAVDRKESDEPNREHSRGSNKGLNIFLTFRGHLIFVLWLESNLKFREAEGEAEVYAKGSYYQRKTNLTFSTE